MTYGNLTPLVTISKSPLGFPHLKNQKITFRAHDCGRKLKVCENKIMRKEGKRKVLFLPLREKLIVKIFKPEGKSLCKGG